MKYALKHFKLIAIAGVTLLLLLFVFARKAQTADQSTGNQSAKGLVGRPSLSVTLAPIQTANWASSLSANGSIAAWQEAIIGAELNGIRLSDISAQIGDKVKRGQVLARFSTDTINTEVAQQEAQLAEAEANLAEAQSNARRAMQLKESGAISIQQINQYATLRNTASARVSAAKAGLQAARLRLRQTHVVAPDDGIISARTATVGAVTQSGQELFRLIRQGKLEWRAEMTAEESARISIGQNVMMIANDGSSIKGKVRMLAPTIDPQTRKTLVYVDLPEIGNTKNIRAGMFAKGEFLLGDNNAASVPSAALVLRDGYASIFVVDAPGSNGIGKARQVRVTTGRTLAGRTEILSAAGEAAGVNKLGKVIDSGAGFLADGDTVRIVDAATMKSNDNPSVSGK